MEYPLYRFSAMHPTVLGEGVVVGGDVGKDGLLVRLGHVNVLGIEQPGDAQVLPRHVKCVPVIVLYGTVLYCTVLYSTVLYCTVLEVVLMCVLVEFGEVDQVRSVVVNQGVEAKTVLP